ncbi:MAG: nucleoside monophosphate kinase [bacterium]|nr:nucleoside monophosphate kinase [bacterium]
MNIVLIGPQGSGKGEQAKRLIEKFNLAYFSAGDLLRDLAGEESGQGKVIHHLMNVEGKLIPDEIMNKLVFDKLNEIDWKNGLLFDGFPRTQHQFAELEKYLTSKAEKVDRLIYLKIKPQTSISRLTSRRICPKCKTIYNLVTDRPKEDEKCDKCGLKLVQRLDESPQAIENRLKSYYELTEPLIDQARKEGLLEEIDGEKPIGEVFQEIVEKLPQ